MNAQLSLNIAHKLFQNPNFSNLNRKARLDLRLCLRRRACLINIYNGVQQ